MAIAVGNPGISGLGIDIVHRAVQAGRLNQLILDCQVKVVLDPDEGSLPHFLSEIFRLIKDQKKEYERLQSQILAMRCSLAPFYVDQYKVMVSLFEHYEEQALMLVPPIVESQCKFIETRLNEVVEKLNIFRKTSSDEHLVEIEKSNLALFSRIKKICTLGAEYVKFNPGEQREISTLKKMSIRLSNVISFQKSGQFGYLFACLKRACEDPGQIDPAFFDQQIESMQDAVVQQLDEVLYDHADEEANSDISWSKSHRYDDIHFFKFALTRVLIQQYETLMLKGVSRNELDTIYQKVFVRAFGPCDEDCTNWVKSEFPSLLNLIEGVYNKLVLKKTGIVSTQFTPEAPSSQIANSTKERKDVIFYYPMTKENIIRHIPESSKAAKLHSLLDKIDLIEAQATTNLKKIDCFAIGEAIIETLPEDLRRCLFGMISFISSEERLGEGWGQRHCTQDIQRLRRAIYNLL